MTKKPMPDKKEILSHAAAIDATYQSESKITAKALITSPPVVQNPRAKSFGVSIAVSRLATAWVEYGFAKDDLTFIAVANHQALHIGVNHSEAGNIDGIIRK